MMIYRFTRQKTKVNQIDNIFSSEQDTFKSRFSASELWEFYETNHSDSFHIINKLKDAEFYKSF